MKVLVFPNYQCAICFTTLHGIITEDRKHIEFKHIPPIPKECPQGEGVVIKQLVWYEAEI